MIKKFSIFILLIFLTSCINPMAFMPGAYGSGRVGPGKKSNASPYKYRCKTTNDCCEVGKNCEEDLKKEESKK